MSETSTNSLPQPVMFGIRTIPRFIIGVAILLGIAINFANVIGRYFFLEPIVWAEEIMIYIMVWTVFVGAVLVSFEGQHLKMDFFSIMMPSPYKEIINFIAAVSVLLVCAYIIPYNWTVVELMWNNDQRSVVAEAPMVIPHFALLLGFVLIFVAVALRFKSNVMGTLSSEVDDIIEEYGSDDAITDENKSL
ncbi:MAG: TRAP transporter small permease [Pseudomonadota bacterium]|nr:TRAP transporter small permease [Pseudomonadota bacterium]